MHEFSIAANLVEKLSEFVRENPDKKICEVRLEIGELSHIEHDQLHFCYESITKETPLEGSTLRIDLSDGQSSYIGSSERFWRVYEREGEPCVNCGTKIRRIAHGGRSTYFCPKCQRR